MKTTSVFKFIVISTIILSFSAINVYSQITPPTGKTWFLVDMETAGSIANLGSQIIPGNNFVFNAANVSSITLADNPNTTNAVNKTLKCINWSKPAQWDGWSDIQTVNKAEYIDLTKWEYLSFDIRIEDALLRSVQIDFNSYNTTSSSWSKVGTTNNIDMRLNGVGRPQATWYTVNIDLTTVTLSSGVVALNNIQKFALSINPYDTNTSNTNVYFDNLRLSRSYSVSGIHNVIQPKFDIYSNPANNTIQIKGVDGKAIIYNNVGIALKQIQELNDKAVDVSDLAKGCYIIKTKLGSKQFLKN